MMRRNRKASLPVNSSVPPAVRRPRAASARESTVAYRASSSSSSSSFGGSSTSDTRRRGDPLPLLLPERKAARWRDSVAALNEPPPEPLAAAQTAAPLPLPPPPPLHHHPPPACAGGSHGARGRVGFQADIIMFNIFHSIPTQMDYKGQKLAEQIFQGIILFSAAVGFVYGYITEQFGWTVYIVMAGFALSCLLTLPPWPIYRRNPLKWLPAQESSTEDKKPTDRKVKRHPKN